MSKWISSMNNSIGAAAPMTTEAKRMMRNLYKLDAKDIKKRNQKAYEEQQEKKAYEERKKNII